MVQLKLIEKGMNEARESNVGDPLGRRESDKLIREVAVKLGQLEIKVDQAAEERSSFQRDIRDAANAIVAAASTLKKLDEWHDRYHEKSEKVGDPHNWIAAIGQPTAKDFNTLKTAGITVVGVGMIIWAFIKLFSHELWALVTGGRQG